MGGIGRERIHNMKHDFKFISKHSPQVKSAYSDLMEILSLVHDDLRKQYTFQHKPVGSYSRNMITYDAKSNIGFDFQSTHPVRGGTFLISTFIPTMKKIASLQNRSNYYSNNHWTNLLIGMATTLPKTQLAS